MTNHQNRSHSVYLVLDDDDRITNPMIADRLTYDRAAKIAKRKAGRGAVFTKYGPTSIAFLGREVTAVVSWLR